MRAARETFSLRSLKVRIALAGAMLILASVALTVIFVLREVGRSSEQMRAGSRRRCRSGWSACSAPCAASLFS
jgi:hypothetical protein